MPATLERIERESQRISDLVGELLVLSRLEAGVTDCDGDAIDIGGLLADIVEDARFEARRNGVSIRYDGIGDIIVQGRSELLHRAFENVLRNAVQHCKKGREVPLLLFLILSTAVCASILTIRGRCRRRRFGGYFPTVFP